MNPPDPTPSLAAQRAAANAAFAFAVAWQKTTEIRREISKCDCTEKSHPCEEDGDPGTPACYRDKENPELMCEPCLKRVHFLRHLKAAKKEVVSLRGKLLRIAARLPALPPTE